VEDEHDQGHDEQEMDEATGDVEGKSSAPKDEKKNGND
jgi:hypothetical protein